MHQPDASAEIDCGPGARSSHRLVRSIVLRALGLVYLAAFGSLAVQVDGLIGSRGILPAADDLDRVRRAVGTVTPWVVWHVPTVFWIDASDRMLNAVCWVGAIAGIFLTAGFLPGPCLVVAWVLYLSLTVVAQDFLSFQWDMLLLESGLLAMLITPWTWRLGVSQDEPWRPAVWLFRWLVFRLMFLSGVVKLAYGDRTWIEWRALDYHYLTQPLPTWTSWFLYQLPWWFHRTSVGLMFYAELLAPFFIFGPRILRRVGFVSLVLLQLLILSTGNYGCFNILAIVLCLSVLDDRDIEAAGSRLGRWRRRIKVVDRPVPVSIQAWSIPRRTVVSMLGGLLVLVTTAEGIREVWPETDIPWPVDRLVAWTRPLRSANAYGLFRVMTTDRKEITVEGSDDGKTWKPYRFRWKPGELDRRPRFATPHMPRLDWQMWFAALAPNCLRQNWFMAFEQRLLEGSPAVLGLIRENPFPAGPPRYIRARLSLYSFTGPGSRGWWTSRELGLYCPPFGLRGSRDTAGPIRGAAFGALGVALKGRQKLDPEFRVSQRTADADAHQRGTRFTQQPQVESIAAE